MRASLYADLLACPACRTALGENLECRCGASYRHSDGIPILRRDDVLPDASSAYVGLGRKIPESFRPLATRLRAVLRPEIVRHFGTPLVEPFVRSFPDAAVILNVGSGGREYGRNDIINLDIEPGPAVDVVGVAEELPIQDGVVDGVILQAVLEHVADGERTLSEIVRVLRTGGRVLVELPFMQGYHASPADYRRYTEFGLRHELQRHGLEVTDSGVGIGPASGFAWVASEFLAILLSGRSQRLYYVTRMLTRPFFWPLKWLDFFLQGHPMAYLIASSVWAEGRKPDDPRTASNATASSYGVPQAGAAVVKAHR